VIMAETEPVQWMKLKYREPLRGIQRRGAPAGNGDSGTHKRRKMPAKERATYTPPTPPTLVVEAGTGKRRWVR